MCYIELKNDKYETSEDRRKASSGEQVMEESRLTFAANGR